MYKNYICQIEVADNESMVDSIYGTLFGVICNGDEKFITAAHVLVSAIRTQHTDVQTKMLYVNFTNHNGQNNLKPVEVNFVAHPYNDTQNGWPSIRFVDAAYVESEFNIPISDFFKIGQGQIGDNVIGLGYAAGSTPLTQLSGVIVEAQINEDKNNLAHQSDRFTVDHDSTPGCSGGPYIKIENDEPLVIGNLIGQTLGNESNNALEAASAYLKF